MKVSVRTAVVGDAAVGKTSIVRYQAGLDMTDILLNTVGATNNTLFFDVNGKGIELNVWDTAGQERYKSVVPIYFRCSTVGIFVFDVTSRESFESLSNWIEIFDSVANRVNIKFIVGNKIDLNDRKVDFQEAKNWAEARNMTYFETSAITGSGINDMFQFIASQLTELKQENETIQQTTIINVDEKKRKCC